MARPSGAAAVATWAILTLSQWTNLMVGIGIAAGVGMIVAIIMLWRKVDDLAASTEGLRSEVRDVIEASGRDGLSGKADD